MGPRDIECQIQLAVISGAATIAGHFVSLRLNDALAAENRGRVSFRINQQWERVIDATILQLNGVRATAAPAASFDIRLELTIKGQERMLAHQRSTTQMTAVLDSGKGAAIRSRIQEACGLTVRNAMVELNGFIETSGIRVSSETPTAEDRSSVAALFRGELPFPLDALPEEVRTFAESLAVRFSVPVCVPATACLALAPEIAGTRIKIDRGYGLPLGCNLYFLVGVDPNSHFRAAVESVLNPALRLREDLIGQARGKGSFGQAIPYSSVLTKWRLKQNRGRSVPLLLSSGIPSVGWDRLVETSWDGVLLHYSWDGDIVRELLKYGEKEKLHPAEKVLKRAYVQESSPFDAHRKEDRVRLQAQSLGLLWFCGTVVEELARSAWQLKDSIRGNHQYKRRECGDSG